MPLNSFRTIYLPYCLKKLQDGRYVVLNRGYKPLGFNIRKQYIYENYPIASRISGLTAKSIKKIAYDGKIKNDMIHLYNDSCIPTKSKVHMTNYLKRLEILARYTISEKDKF